MHVMKIRASRLAGDAPGNRQLRLILVTLILLIAACGGSSSDTPGPGTSLVPRDFDGPINAVAAVESTGGDVFVAGNFTTYNGQVANSVVRLNPDGTLDGTFDAQDGFNGTIVSIAPANDGTGDLYVGGLFTSYNGTSAARIARLNSDGSIDLDFASGLGFSRTAGGAEVKTLLIAADASGDLYVGGDFDTYDGASIPPLVRLNSDGSLDAGLALGSGFTDSTRPVIHSLCAATDTSGDLYVAGDFETFGAATVNNLLRLNSNGTRDTGFSVGLGLNAPPRVVLAAQDSSGDVYVAGGFTAYKATAANGILRISADGTRDATFNEGVGFDSDVNALHLPADGTGDVFAGGDFLTYQSISSPRIVRINANGTRDSDFAQGAGFDAAVLVIAAPPDAPTSGAIYAGGAFSLYDSRGVTNFMRANEFGTPN
jgi:uncharacterized delta-60 repeat protein